MRLRAIFALAMFATSVVPSAAAWLPSSVAPPTPPQHQSEQQQLSSSAGESAPDVPQIESPDDRLADYTFWLVVVTAALAVATSIQLFFLIRADRTSARAAKAADLSARAAVKLELPIIRQYGSPELIEMDGPMPKQDAYGANVVSALPLGQFCAVPSLQFWNAGRTPAIVTGIELGFFVGRALPNAPHYAFAETIPAGITMNPQAERNERRFDMPMHTIALTDEERAALVDASSNLWVFVRLTFNDFMDEPHMAGFCWQWRADVYGNYLPEAYAAPADYTKRT